jgi:hypothetical protein
MARQRTLKMEFWADEGLATSVSRDARMLYMGLWNLCDEAARGRGSAAFIKGQIFPYDDDLTAARVELLLQELARAGKIQRYTFEGESYLFLPKLSKHQRLEPEKTESKLPNPPEPSKPSDANDSELFRETPEDHALLFSSSSLSSSSLVRPGAGASGSDKSAPSPLAKSKPDPKDFDRFWGIYPRRESKGAARAAWEKAIKKAPVELILAGASSYRDDGSRQRAEPKFTKLPATWLNAECWLDERPPEGLDARASPSGPEPGYFKPLPGGDP